MYAVRLLHTSDWHLGRSFHGAGLLAAQAAFLDHLVEVVRAESVDVVAVAGDVYDRALPAPDTVALLSQACERLVDAGAQVVLSSGNHDSAIRLGFASGLLERSGLHIRTSIDELARPVIVNGVAVVPIPYLEPSQVCLSLGAARSHDAVLRAAVGQALVGVPAGMPTVVLAHAFVTGGATSDSERDLTVGGVGTASASAFDGVTYAALGHLHRPQALSERVRYSGSPLAFSFSEAGHEKSSVLVDIEPDGAVSCTQLPTPVPRRIASITGRLDDLLTDRAWTLHEQSWVQAVLTDNVRPVAAMERLRRRFPHCVDLRFEPAGAAPAAMSYSARLRARTGTLEVVTDFIRHARGEDHLSQAEASLVAEAVEQARLTGAARDDRVPADQRAAASGALVESAATVDPDEAVA